MTDTRWQPRNRRSVGLLLTGAAIGVLVGNVAIPLALGTQQARDVTPIVGAAPESSPSPARTSAPGVTDDPRGSTSTNAATSTDDTSRSAAEQPPDTAPATPTTQEAAPTSPPATSPEAPSTPSPAPEYGRGIDADRRIVTVGIMVPDIAGLDQIGSGLPGLSVEDQKRMWNAYIDDLNRRGGIDGFTIEPIFAVFDLLDPASARAACLELTENNRVFIVFDPGTTGPVLLCFTEEHQQMTISAATSPALDEIYQRSGDLLFTMMPRGSRIMRDAPHMLQAVGALEDASIGIVTDEVIDPRGATTDVLDTTLAAIGHDVVHRSTLSADPDTQNTQIPLEVRAMQNAGVDTVFATSLSMQRWVQVADANGFRPQYLATDWAFMYSDASTSNMTSGFDNAIGITYTTYADKNDEDAPEQSMQQRCRAIYEQQTATTQDPKATGTQGSAYITNMWYCGVFMLFEEGMTGAGASLPYPNFAAGMHAIGTIELPNIGRASIQHGKNDAANWIRRTRWEYDCLCWLPAGTFQPPATS